MSPALQIGPILGFIVVALPAYWLLSRLALRSSAPTTWLRRLLVTLVPLAGVAYLLFSRVAVADLTRSLVTPLFTGFPTPVQSTLADVAAQFALFLSTAGVVLAAYAVVVPAIRRAREIELSTPTAVRRMGRYLAAFAIVLTVFFVPFRRVVAGESPGVASLALILLLLAVPFLTPVLSRAFRSIRAPERSERDRIDASCERAGLDVVDSWILTDADETVEVSLRGLPGRRHLYVSAFALSGFDDETLRALLAANAGRASHHYRMIKIAPLFGFVVAGVVALTWGSLPSYAVLIAIALFAPLPVLWAARRAVRRADDYAAARVGSDAVADALERVATEQNLDIPSGGVTTILKSRPPLRERIDRLRNGGE